MLQKPMGKCTETSVVRNGKSKSMENVSDQILKVPPDEQRPEPPLVKDEGAAEL